MIGSHKKNIGDILGRSPVHPFPARMAPGIAFQIVSDSKKRLRVLDPMAGSGTVPAVARANGHIALGVDIDPLAVLISKVWTTPIKKEEILKASKQVLANAKRKAGTLSSTQAFPDGASAETKEFIKYWFDLRSRRQLASLSVEIKKVKNENIRNALLCSFSRLIISKKSGASLAMDLSHSRPHRKFKTAPIQPFEKWDSAVEKVLCGCLDAKSATAGPSSKIKVGDARALPFRSNSIDLVLTSPPYLNAIDYIRCSKFSLVWMGLQTESLKKIRGKSVGSEVSYDIKLCSSDLQNVISGLRVSKKLSSRNLGILTRYVVDMHLSIEEVARVLVPGGRAVYVVGENSLRDVYIRNAKIVSDLAILCGLRLIERRTRTLPDNRRYLPPPKANVGAKHMNSRMRKEIVLAFEKS